MKKKSTKVLSGALATTTVLTSVMGATPAMAANNVDELFNVAYTATEVAKTAKTQEKINEARKAVRELKEALKNDPKLQANLVGNLSSQLDPLQQEQFVAFYAVMYKEDKVTLKENLSQTEINKARDYVIAFKGAAENEQYVPSWSSALDKFQQANIDNVTAAVKKASESKKDEDVKAARKLVDELLTVTNNDSVKKAAESLEIQVKEVEKLLQTASLKETKAISANKIEVTFNAPVDTAKAKFGVKKGSVDSKVSKVTWNTEKTVATLEMGSKLFAGDYTVEVKDLTEKALTSKVTVENEKVSKIEILGEKAALVTIPGVTGSVKIGYKVLNQYGEDITTKVSLESSVSQGVVSFKPSENIIEVSGIAFPKVGDKLSLTLVHGETATTASKVLTIDEVAKIDTIDIKGLYNADKKELTEDNKNNDFYVLFDAKDQYGNKISEKEAQAGLLVYVQNPLVAKAQASDIKEITIDGKKQLALKLDTSNSKTGNTDVLFVSLGTGKKASLNVEVTEGSTVHNFVLSQPEVAAAGEKVVIPFEAFSKNGNKVEKESLLKEVKFEAFGSGNVKPVIELVKNVSTGKLELVLDLTNFQVPQNGTGKVTITALTKTHQVTTMTIDVRKERVPKTIDSISSDIVPNVQIGTSVEIKPKHIIVKDQHGTNIKIADHLGDKVGDYRVNFVNKSAIAAQVTNIADPIMNSSTDSVIVEGVKKGTDVFTVQLEQKVNSTGDNAKDWKMVEGSSTTFSVRVADKTEYESYIVDKVDTIYDDVKAEETAVAEKTSGKYASWVGVYGVLPNGQKVELPGSDYSVSTETEGLVATQDKDGYRYVNAVSKNKDGKFESLFNYASGKTETAGKITVTINATGEQLNKEVTISNVAPKVDYIELDKTRVQDNFAEVSNLSSDLFALVSYVEDQYGEEAKINPATGKVTFADKSNGDTTLLVTDYLRNGEKVNTVKINNNGTKDMVIDGAEVGDTFGLTINVGGIKKTIKVKVNKVQ